MMLERSEFFGVSNIESKFIYVFGGTLKNEDWRILERYNSKEDAWEVLDIKINT